MANLRVARRNLYGIAGVLLVVDVVALFILISPFEAAGGARDARQDEFRQLRTQVQTKARTVVPPDKLQERVEEARTQIATFVKERIPAQSSALSVELGQLAKDAGVRLGSVRYTEVDSDVPDLRRYQINATISGDYVQDVKFINALERTKTFFVIDAVTLAEQQTGVVRLGLNLDAYLREQP